MALAQHGNAAQYDVVEQGARALCARSETQPGNTQLVVDPRIHLLGQHLQYVGIGPIAAKAQSFGAGAEDGKRGLEAVCQVRRPFSGEGDGRLLRLQQLVDLADDRLELVRRRPRQPLHGALSNVANLPAQDAERFQPEMHLDGRRNEEDGAQNGEGDHQIGAKTMNGVVVPTARFGDRDAEVASAPGTLDHEPSAENDQPAMVGSTDLPEFGRSISRLGGDRQFLVPQGARADDLAAVEVVDLPVEPAQGRVIAGVGERLGAGQLHGGGVDGSGQAVEPALQIVAPLSLYAR